MTEPRPPLFDFQTARRAAARARRMAERRFLTAGAAGTLAERLGVVTRRFEKGLMIGGPVPESLRDFASAWAEADFDQNEILHTAAGFDLVVSIFSLQAINDLPGALVQIRRALKPDGLFLGAILGGGTLRELRESFAAAEAETIGGISPRVSPFADVRDMGSLLQRAGFALPVTDVERCRVLYPDFSGLVRDLRAHGLTNVLSERRRAFLRRDTLAALLAHYRAHHAGAEGKLRATFEIVYLTGWAPHESQPQPLKPGSAKARLAEALGTVEQTLTEGLKPIADRAGPSRSSR